MKKLSCKELYILPHLMHYKQKQKSTHPFLINPETVGKEEKLRVLLASLQMHYDSFYSTAALIKTIYLKTLICP